jgi:two-component system NtrC family sensor kinase
MNYAALQRKMIGITLLVSLAPLLVLGSTIYYHFSEVYKQRMEEQILYRARAQANAVDLFLKERAAILSAIASPKPVSIQFDDVPVAYRTCASE